MCPYPVQTPDRFEIFVRINLVCKLILQLLPHSRYPEFNISQRGVIQFWHFQRLRCPDLDSWQVITKTVQV